MMLAIVGACTVGVVVGALMFFVPGERALRHPGETPLTRAVNTTIAGNSTLAVHTDPAAGYQKVNVTINGFTLVADVAVTQDQKRTGLDIRDSMAENQGMLFPFTDESNYGFWMKGMKFPLDIFWLDAGKKVVHVERNLPPCGGIDLMCPLHDPPEKAMYVLETTADFSARHNVTVGTPVLFALRS